MGIPARFAKAWGTARLTMRQFLVALCFLPAILADAEAEPGYGHRGHYAARSYAPKCHTTYETVTREACTTTYESVCSTETTTNFVTRNEQECSTRSVQECATTVRNVSEQQCTSEQECTTETQTVVDTTYTDECQDIVTQSCTETSVSVQTQHAVVGHAVSPVAPVAVAPALAGPLATPAAGHVIAAATPAAGHVIAAAPAHVIPARIGKRDADAEPEADAQFLGPLAGALTPYAAAVQTAPLVRAQAPACHAVTERQCRKVPVQVPRTISVPKCVTVPRCIDVPRSVCNTVYRKVPETRCNPKPVTECTTINRQVPETNCVDRPVQECVNVPKSVPVQVPVERCADVPREVCHPVQTQVPRQVCEQVAVKHVAHGVYANSPALSRSIHGVRVPTSYGYGVGNSYTRRDY